MKKMTLPNPDIGQTIQYTVISRLEKKYPGHDFAVFGQRLYVDDKHIPFAYNDSNMEIINTIVEKIEREVRKLV